LKDRSKDLLKHDIEELIKKDELDDDIKKKLADAEKALDNNDFGLYKSLLSAAQKEIAEKSKDVSRKEIENKVDKYSNIAHKLKFIGEIIKESVENNKDIENADSVKEKLKDIWNEMLEMCTDDPRFKNKDPEIIKIKDIPVKDSEQAVYLQEIKDLLAIINKI